MKIRSISTGLCLLLAMTLLTSVANAQGRRKLSPGKEAPHPPKVGENAPDFELKNLKGEAVSLKTVSYTHLTLPTIYSV